MMRRFVVKSDVETTELGWGSGACWPASLR